MLVHHQQWSATHTITTIELSIEHLLTAVTGVLALLLLPVIQKSETSLPELAPASATRPPRCCPHTEEWAGNGETAWGT